MRYSIARFIAGILLLLSIGLPSSVAHATTPANWKDSGFAINAAGMQLGQVLHEFGQAYGVNVAIKVNDRAILKGRLKADNGAEFLDRLSSEYNFNWFVYAGTLYIVSRTDTVSVRLDIGEDAVQDAKAALIGVGLFDTRFGWGELPDDGVVLINGPREYVRLAEAVLNPDRSDEVKPNGRTVSREPGAAARKKLAYDGKQVMIFRLKYASAVDRDIVIRGQKETVTGIKTILTQLLGQADISPGHVSNDDLDITSGKRSRRQKNRAGGDDVSGNSILAKPREADDTAVPERRNRASKNTASPPQDPPRIDADPALNAIIIYDVEAKREMYRTLIDQLDVEPQQIEIEAMIVDIDRGKLQERGTELGLTDRQIQATSNVPWGNSSYAQNNGNSTAGGAGRSTVLISNPNFYKLLREMEQEGDADILAKPTILTLDNVAAVLDLSQTRYIPLVGERVSDLANVTAGTMLRVVPRVLRENGETRVRLDIDIEDGSLGSTQDSNTMRSTITTQAIIREQQTLMVGGYHVESRTRTVQKVPMLGDLPLVGGLFRSPKENSKGRERLFLITPRLLDATGMRAAKRSATGRLAREVALDDLSNNVSTESDAPAEMAVPQPSKHEPLQRTQPQPPASPPPAPAPIDMPGVQAQLVDPAGVPVSRSIKTKCTLRRKPDLVSPISIQLQ